MSVQGQINAIKQQSLSTPAPVKITADQILAKKQPTASPAPAQPAPAATPKDNAVQKTLDLIKQQQQPKPTVAAPTPSPAPAQIAKPADEKKPESKTGGFGKLLDELQNMTAHVNTTINATTISESSNSNIHSTNDKIKKQS